MLHNSKKCNPGRDYDVRDDVVGDDVGRDYVGRDDVVRNEVGRDDDGVKLNCA
jgi:hypothetical protein